MSLLADRLLEIHRALQDVHLAHAFGGAIALAYCTEEPRGTRDLDVNVFVGPDRAPEVFAALPDEVLAAPADLRAAERDGQVRLWWEDTPVDLFLDVHDFHRKVFRGVRWVPFEGQSIPVVGCNALAVFKALLDRTKDWADIEAMLDDDSLDLPDVIAELGVMLGSDSAPVRRLSKLAA
ncbi:MAG TPA: hypothetical protein VMU32_12950 [Solirubrobacteraceae bacterium]|nr:hypothetical protein [Solirubrobacteraceae bacterium]